MRTQTQSGLASPFGACREAVEALGLPRRANLGLSSPGFPGGSLLKTLSSMEGHLAGPPLCLGAPCLSVPGPAAGQRGELICMSRVEQRSHRQTIGKEAAIHPHPGPGPGPRLARNEVFH